MADIQKILARLPHAPGVYLFRDKDARILYVGKAKDLKKRVSQYWVRDGIGPKTAVLVSQVADVQTVQTATEFDALLLEAKLIHDLAPKYNVVLKDDKSPLYILLTLSETLPRVATIRRRDIPKKLKVADRVFGPFPSARVVRSMLRQLRQTIPYCTQKRRTGSPCFYTHLGLCAPCPSAIIGMADERAKAALIREYRTNILRLKHLLSGRATRVVHDLTKRMQTKACGKRYEEAANIRDHIQHLCRILQTSYDPMVYVSSDMAVEDIRAQELSVLAELLSPYLTVTSLARIECIDISNMQGTYATGSLVVLTEGSPDTSAYKRFRIRTVSKPNDAAMIREVVRRRFLHTDWPLPDLLVVDGGKAQVTAARIAIAGILSERQHSPGRVEGSLRQTIPVIGLAKRFEEIVIPLPSGGWKAVRLPLTSPGMHLIQRIRDEAHRFAQAYHRLLRGKRFATITPT